MKATHMKRRRARRYELRIMERAPSASTTQPEKNTARIEQQRDGKRFYMVIIKKKKGNIEAADDDTLLFLALSSVVIVS